MPDLPSAPSASADSTSGPSSPTNRNARLPLKEVGSYAIGAVGSNVIYALVAIYLTVFYTDYAGLSPGSVALLVLVVRGWDAVLDVLMGIMVDNTKSRWGKFRPYLAFGGLLTGLSAASCFISPDFSAAGKLIYAYCTYIVWSMSYTLCDIPFWSLTPAMTNDPAERTRVTAISRTGAQFGFWIIYVGALPAVKFFGGSWALVGALAGIICVVCFWVAFWNVREHCVTPRHQRQTPKTAFRFFLSNRPLLYLMITCLLLEIVSNIRGGFAFYFFKYYLGREDLIPWAMGANITFVIVGCICAPAVGRRLGKVKSVIAAYLLAGAATAAMYFGGHNIAAFMILTAVAGFFDGVGNIIRNSCLADCVEYGQWKTGERSEGLVFSANIFKSKVASALAGAIPLLFLRQIGWVANTVPSESIQYGIALFFTVILGAATIVAIVPMFRYELSERRYAEIVDELNQRKRA